MQKRHGLVAALLAILLVFAGCAPSVSKDQAGAPPAVSKEQTGAPPAVSEEQTGAPPAVSEEQTGARPEEQDGLLGEIDGDQYVNHALNFTAPLPDGWQFASDDVLEAAAGMARDTIEQETDLEAGSTVTLMLCTQYAFDPASGVDNPNINMNFTNSLSTVMMLTDEGLFNDFIDQYVAVYNGLYTGADNQLTGEWNVQINGKAYAAVYAEVSADDSTMYQDQYYTDVSDGVLITTLTYFDEAEKDKLFGFMQSLKYEK